MIIMPRNKKWSDLTVRQKAPFVLRGIVQFALLVAALADVFRRPAEEIRGSKWLWGVAAFANFMGIGPIAYFLFGRKHAARRITDTEGDGMEVVRSCFDHLPS